MDCPRCRLPLKKVDYEGVETDMCPQCWGFWLDTGEIEQVLDLKKFVFSEEEKEQVLDLMSASDPGPTEPAPCPRCGKIMDRFHYDQAIHLVLDRCKAHGIWLDTGEIKKVQTVAEKSQKVHKLLLKKMGALSKA